MLKIVDKEKCCGCHACYSICPKQCITMVKDEEGFLYPLINTSICVNCGLCEKVCPFSNSKDYFDLPKAFAVTNKDEIIRINSSSGGVFSALSEKILQQNGVVYGVVMDSTMRVAKHVRVDSFEDYIVLRGSKYLESIIGDTFIHTKQDLQKGRSVLFSGTPCQINGLKNYLGKDYDNLITVDVICHGIPSQKLWEMYVDYLESKYSSKIISVNFREKPTKTKRFGIKKQGVEHTQFLSTKKDPYLKMFLHDYCLRPSCYSCKVKENGSSADLTIADFWGIENIIPEIDSEKGASLVLTHTKKGKMLLDNLHNQLKIIETDFDLSIAGNSSYNISASRPVERNDFYRLTRNKDMKFLMKKYCKHNISNDIKSAINLIKRIILKCIRKKSYHSKMKYGLKIKLKK